MGIVTAETSAMTAETNAIPIAKIETESLTVKTTEIVKRMIAMSSAVTRRVIRAQAVQEHRHLQQRPSQHRRRWRCQLCHRQCSKGLIRMHISSSNYRHRCHLQQEPHQ